MTDLVRSQSEQWEQLKSLVLDSVHSPNSKRAYRQALDDFHVWYSAETRPPFSKAIVHAYRAALEARGLAPSTVNIALSALRKLATEAADNGLLAPELAAGVGRVKGVKRLGVRTGNWLTREQAETLINCPDPTTPKGKRDRAILAVLIGCGLRRSELASLALDRIQQRDARWVIVDLVGKGGRLRTVPMPSWAKSAVDQWVEAAAITSGQVFRPVNRGGRVWGECLSDKVIWQLVEAYARCCGIPHLAPHDLRRTFAKLAHKGRAALEQIQLSLGHASVQTTERYLGVDQDLTDAPCDHLGLRIAA